jgi:acyl-CoA synthetase (AMP-forming)/AMP-acid ligase II
LSSNDKIIFLKIDELRFPIILGIIQGMYLKLKGISNLAEVWLKTVTRFPRKTAVMDLTEERSWTFTEMHERVVAAAQGLPSSLKGMRIAFEGGNHSEWLVRFLAIQVKGGIAIAFDPGLSREQLGESAKQQEVHYFWIDQKLTAVDLPSPRRRLSKIAFEKLTSGSTGRPKLIPWTHENLLADGDQIMKTMGIRPTDRQLGLIPLAHSYGMGSLVLPLILQGTTVALAAHFVPSQFSGWIRKWKLTVYPTVPAVLQVLLATPSIQSLKPLRFIVSAGARLEGETARLFYKKFKIRIHNFYGSTETGGIAYDRTGRITESGRAIGRPLRGVQIRFNDEGRIEVRSPAVALGQGKYLMEDTGFWNAKRELVLTGRVRPAVNVGGKKIYPAEIERIFSEIKGVGDVWVGSIESRGREHLVSAGESDREEAEIYQALARKLPAWKIPRKIRVLSSFPRTVRGKVDLLKIKEEFNL